jgi:hypothetical protein
LHHIPSSEGCPQGGVGQTYAAENPPLPLPVGEFEVIPRELWEFE